MIAGALIAIERLVGDPPEWTLASICTSVDPEIFYPEKGGSTREGKKVCRARPVVNACLQYALDNQERFGIWGAHSERERRKLLTRRRAA